MGDFFQKYLKSCQTFVCEWIYIYDSGFVKLLLIVYLRQTVQVIMSLAVSYPIISWHAICHKDRYYSSIITNTEGFEFMSLSIQNVCVGCGMCLKVNPGEKKVLVGGKICVCNCYV